MQHKCVIASNIRTGKKDRQTKMFTGYAEVKTLQLKGETDPRNQRDGTPDSTAGGPGGPGQR